LTLEPYPQANDMNQRNSPAGPLIEILECRTLLCGVAADPTSATTEQSSAVVSPAFVAAKAAKVKDAGTATTIAVSAGTLGQPITFTVTVRAAAAAGAPTGTINLVYKKTVVETLTLAPATSTNAKYAISQANYTLTAELGGGALYIGKQGIGANYLPTGAFSKSKVSANFNVAKPTYTALANGVKYETIIPGSGAGIQNGQYAEMLYTGYLAKSGKIFDDSVNHESNGVVSPFQFQVGAGQVIAGFDEASVGMEVGESRLVLIPPAEGYGKKKNGSIPGNSTLLFEITLQSFSDTAPASS
jgi:hypothetical protein